MGFWQPLIPENLPKYCGYCFHQGHDADECWLKNPALSVEPPRGVRRTMTQEFRQKEDPASGSAGEKDEGGPMLPKHASAGEKEIPSSSTNGFLPRDASSTVMMAC